MKDSAKYWRSAIALVVTANILGGCGGHEARTLKMRTALDVGDSKKAILALNEEMDVGKDTDLPEKVEGDNAILLLDRASIQQSLAQFKNSQRDFEAADKAIDMLDISRNVGDEIGQYIYSDAAGRYKAPPYEKLLINTLDMLNYLEQKDLNGARIEARRLSVMQKYFHDNLKEETSPMLGLGGFLAGLAFEKSGESNEALRYYDEALAFSGFRALEGPVRLLVLAGGSYMSPRIKAALEKAPGGDQRSETLESAADDAELVVVIGYGRVPHKIAKRIPIGLALTYFSGAISPGDRTTANKLAAQGLVTWVNYPSLAPDRGSYSTPTCRIDSGFVALEESVNVSASVRSQWSKMEGKIVASAITRTIARFAVGQGIQTVGGRDSILAFLASLGAQAALTAADTPDTRSWETLPARVAVARVRLPPGKHKVHLEARGVTRDETVDLPKGGWKVVSLMALR